MSTSSSPRPARAEDVLADLNNWTHTLELTHGPSDAPQLHDQEWLLTNGAGSFAMGTVAGVNTRRYHGLLIASAHPPVGRVLALNQVLERLDLAEGDDDLHAPRTVEFTACQFRPEHGQDVFAPRGFEWLRRFQRGLSVCWTYRDGALTFERHLTLHWKQPAITLRYIIRGLDVTGQAGTLQLSPMLTLRDFHSLMRAAWSRPYDVDHGTDDVRIAQDVHAVTLTCPGATFVRGRDTWHDVYYAREQERGSDCREDYFVPGTFEVALEARAQQTVELHAQLGKRPIDKQQRSADRRVHLTQMVEAMQPRGSRSIISDSLRRQLAIAADDFVVDRMLGGRKLSTILAGYPWFSDWGRDTFIALPGLLLETGRYEEARRTFEAFAGAIRNGLIPNRFDDYDESAAHYNTVDASLWFIVTAMRYRDVTQDEASWVKWLAPACQTIIDRYLRGTENQIAVGGDGLVAAGHPGTQLTWMDAATGGVVFTPRHGKAIEINALWHHAVSGMAARLADSDKSTSEHFDKLASRCRRAFARVFWLEDVSYLADHVWTDEQGVDHVDRSLRPNQVFAISLPDSPLPLTKCRKVVDAVRMHLLTPMGLRTLPMDDPNYHGRYIGDQFHRDKAYHQGTVWPWLIGPYAEAVLRCGRFSDKARQEALRIISPLLDFMQHEGLGQLNEIHEGDVPYRPVGCPAQAWSVAEVLRIVRLIEDGQP